MLEPLEGKTILVTGAGGFIGRHLVERISRVPRARLVLLSRRPLEPVAGADAVSITADCRDLCKSTWLDRGIKTLDFIFHLAAEIPKTAAGTSDAAGEANVEGTRRLIESLPAAPERFVLASTVDVYAPAGPHEVLREDSPLGPQGAYAASKLRCEELSSQLGFSCAVLRFGHIFGPGEHAFKKLIPETIRRLLRRQPPVMYGSGSAKRDYLYAADVVEGACRAAALPTAAGQPINLVSGQSHTIRSVVRTLADLARYSGPIEHIDQPDGHSLCFDNRLMRQHFGSWEQVPLEQGLRREFDYFRALSN